MGKIIFIRFRRANLPRRLLNDGWWLETGSSRSTVVAFPALRPPQPAPGPKRRFRHLTLVKSEK